MFRSPVREWQVSWFVLGTIALSGTDITIKRLDRNVKTFNVDSSAIFANNGVCAIQSYCPQNKPADLPLLYWRPVRVCPDSHDTPWHSVGSGAWRPPRWAFQADPATETYHKTTKGRLGWPHCHSRSKLSTWQLTSSQIITCYVYLLVVTVFFVTFHLYIIVCSCVKLNTLTLNWPGGNNVRYVQTRSSNPFNSTQDHDDQKQIS